MRSCSDSIAQLASALAKAQIELVNPAKTLTGIIDRWGTGNEGRSYRYAPLSAGLEIVRNALCKHELAVIQTTHFEQESGLVMLTTTLAHWSGEWVSAAWPVCRTADLTNPKLMGAALTYARRYGLFTLVGIAGEDDLDAPEPVEIAGTEQARNGSAWGSADRGPTPDGAASAFPVSAEDSTANGARAPQRIRKTRSDAGRPRRMPASLSTELSPAPAAGSFEFVLRELAAMPSAEALFQWALGALPFRNALSESSRATLDAAFFEKADELGADPELLVALQPRPEPPNRAGAVLRT